MGFYRGPNIVTDGLRIFELINAVKTYKLRKKHE